MSNRLKVFTGESGGYSPGSYYKAPNAAVIDIHSEESLDKWASILGLSRKELMQAIEDFGPVVRNIRRGLRQSDDEAA